MPFSVRNARYLRISAHTVLPLYIYLDDKHVEWMSDYILQRVLADLKPNIGPKLRTESNMYGGSGGSVNAKKGSLDVHRGDTYQFAYFFRKIEPHAVLIKTRTFVPAPVSVPAKAPSAEDQPSTVKKRKRETSNIFASGSKKRSGRKHNASDSGRDATTDDRPLTATEGEKPRRSGRKRSLVAGGYKDADVQEEDDVEMAGPRLDLGDNFVPEDEPEEDYVGTPSQTSQQSRPVDLEDPGSSPLQQLEPHIFDADAEEEKLKMALRVSYRGFTIYDRCLCVIIEPWPSLRDASQAPSLTLDEMRMSSVTPMDEHRQTPLPLRERTPLFLAELDPRRSLTPAPLPPRILPPVPLFDDPTEPPVYDEENESGMMAFSQVLKSAGDERAGSADEDEDDGDVFLGDADERKGGL